LGVLDASAVDERIENEEENKDLEAAGDLLDAEFEFLEREELESVAQQP